jgi:tetratricopeptide (TPR) repeat protein
MRLVLPSEDLMLRTTFHRLLLAAVASLAVALAAPAFAQSTGMVKGKVLDGQNQPVEAAKISIEFADGMNRKYETKTNKKGEFIQIGLQPGNYRVTAEKEKVGLQSFDVRVRLGSAAEVNFQLTPDSGSGRPMTKEEAAKVQAFKGAFDAGVTASNAGDHDTALAKFTEALTMQLDCYACQFNIGGAYSAKKDYAKAEEAYKKAMLMRPDSGEPYAALANIYNTQRRFDEASAMSAEATKRAGSGSGDGGADELFNQGVIFWNAGKIAEAKKQFEQALAINGGLADAHYWVAMANLNEGNLPVAATHFEEYLKLVPDGQYADQAKGVLTQIKK